MSLLSNAIAIPPASVGYNLTDSIRFRQSASAYLSRTPSSTGNRKTWTWSAWIKRGRLGLGENQFLFDSTWAASTTGWLSMRISTDDTLYMDTYSLVMNTSAKLRDPSAWYHVIFVIDTTESTASDRVKIYLNGTQLTVTGSFPALNSDTAINSTNLHAIGRYNWGGIPQLDGYLTEINFVDGQALTPSDFGEYDDDTGVWKPKEYTGTYGTNGFYLDMSTSGSTVTDQSGNGNNWTATNMNLTTSSDTTYDKMSDVPTLTDEDTGNFCTMNAVNKDSTVNLIDGNLQYSASVSAYKPVYGTMGAKSGKWYMEMKLLGQPGAPDLGWFEHDANPTLGGFNQNTRPNLYGVATNGAATSVLSFNNTSTTTISNTAWATNDIIGCAIDMDNKKIWFHRNGTWYPASSGGTAGNPSAGTDPTITYTYDDYLVPRSACYSTNYNALINFGQRPFAYTPPTGYKKLNTYNLPDSTIVKGNEYFDTSLYQGTGSTQVITNSGFSPDLVWQKPRNESASHRLVDSVRGVNKVIYANQTSGESTETNTLTSFNSNGFTGGGSNAVSSGYNAVAWQWRGSDSSPVSNTDGGRTSLVSANTTSGFSVCTYTGNGSTTSFGHGLGVAPDMVIAKSLDASYAYPQWYVYHRSLGYTKPMFLNLTDDAWLTTTTYWSNNPDSSKVYIGSDPYGPNVSGDDYVAYCFAPVEGFSKFGSYTGNGSTDGPFVYTGFRPAFVMIKRTDSSSWWYTLDAKRNTYNVVKNYLSANDLYAEYSNVDFFDFTSNGFKLRTSNGEANASGGTYIYMAFAENPFKNSLAR